MGVIEDKYKDIEDQLTNLAKANNVDRVIIPRWDPVNLVEGLKWIRSTIFEGYYVKWQLKNNAGQIYIEVLSWEYGEDEPEFA